MKIHRVTATSFGPYHGDVLELADGFTIVFGPNEAGKSSWHAATYSALCGMRRGKGQLRSADVAFAARHRPWRTTGAWRVGCNVELDNGKFIEVTWNLDERIGKAFDDLGRDVTIPLNDGSIDLAYLVGLDRATFLATACVRQTELLSVRDDPNALQEHLQRAAATGGADATAAGALQSLADFRRDRVGLLRSNSNKPWQSAKRSVDSARLALDNAQAGQKARLELAVGLQRAQRDSDEAGALITITEAALSVGKAHRDLSFATAAAEEHRALRNGIDDSGRRIAHLFAREEVLAAAIETVEACQAEKAVERDLETTRSIAGERRVAEEEVALASARVDVAQAAHVRAVIQRRAAALVEAREVVASATARAGEASEELLLARRARAAAAAAAAVLDAESARRVADRVAALIASAPMQPDDTLDLEGVAREVAVALDAWAKRPAEPPSAVANVDILRREIDELPPMPVGDLAPREEILAAERALADATARLDGHAAGRLPTPDTPTGDESELRRLAEILSSDHPDVAAAQQRSVDTRAHAQRVNRSSRRTGIAVTGAIVAVLGAVLAVLVAPPAAALVVIGLVVVGFGMRRVASQPDAGAIARMVDAEADLERVKAVTENRVLAERRAIALGFEPSTDVLRKAADAIAAGRIAQENLGRWMSQQAVHGEGVVEARELLGEALVAAGVDVRGEISAALDYYKLACVERAEIAARAGQRPTLEARLATQQAAHAAASSSLKARGDSAERLRSAGALVGVEGDDLDTLARALTRWLQGDDDRKAAKEHARDEQRELTLLLGSCSPDEVEARATHAEERRDELAEVARQSGASLAVAEDCAAVAAELPGLEARVNEAVQAETAARDGRLAAANESLARLEDEPPPSEPSLPPEMERQVSELASLGEERIGVELRQAEEAADRATQTVAELRGQLQERPEPTDITALRRASGLSRERLVALLTAHPDVAASLASDGLAIDDALPPRLPLLADLVTARDESARKRQDTEQARAELEGRFASNDSHLPDVEAADQRARAAEACLHRLRELHSDVVVGFDVSSVPTCDDLEERLAKLDDRRTAALECAAEKRGELASEDARHVPVAAAEENLASCLREEERLSRLDGILAETTTYLETAQDRVHRDIAPRLAASAQKWLPQIFGDRYQRVVVDPQHLVVKVGPFGEEPRDAMLLSHGTSEQLFLLLRLALVQHLTKASGESCPLLLDDITAHFDDAREASVLRVLHEVSADRQVVLFTQEDSVRVWAERHFDTDCDAIVKLSLTG